MFDGGDQRDEAARAGLTVDEFREWSELNGTPLCGFRMVGCADRLPGLRSYRRASRGRTWGRLGVTEFAQEGRASDEVRELWRWVLKKLAEGSLDHEQHTKKAAC